MDGEAAGDYEEFSRITPFRSDRAPIRPTVDAPAAANQRHPPGPCHCSICGKRGTGVAIRHGWVEAQIRKSRRSGAARIFDLRGSDRHADCAIRPCRTDRTYRRHARTGRSATAGTAAWIGAIARTSFDLRLFGNRRRRGTRILVRAVDAAGPALSLAERARRLIEGRDGALVAFGPDGTLLHATAAAAQRLNAETSLEQIKDKAESGRSGTGGYFDAGLSHFTRRRVGDLRADRRRDGIDGAQIRCTR